MMFELPSILQQDLFNLVPLSCVTTGMTSP